MLRGTRENISFLASISNCAGVMALCFLLLATTVVISPGNLHGPLSSSAFAQEAEDSTETGAGEQEVDETEALPTLIRLIELAGVTDPEGLAEIAAVDETEELAEMTGSSDTEQLAATPGITSPEALEAIVQVPDLEGLADLVGLSPDALPDIVLPEVPSTEEPPITEKPPTTDDPATDDGGSTDNPPATDDGGSTDNPPATDALTAEIISNETEDDAPATFEFEANASGGTEPYTYSWNFDDGSEESDEQTVSHTFVDPATYNVALSLTDSEGETASDTLEVIVEASTEEPPTTDNPPATDDGGSTDDNGTATDDPATDDGGVDKSGVDELYPTASSGPTWYIKEQEDPTADGYLYYGIYEGTTIDYKGSGVWTVNAQSGTQEHGIRIHVDSPTGKWKNTEMTGYFNVESGDDQFTMIARHGPSYHDNGGCEAYGYYALTAVDGNVYFKKKLYHFNDGYTKRLAEVPALGDLHDKWVGMKFVVYDLPNGDVKLELWIDNGDMTNNWHKETELIDKGNLAVEGGDDCGRQATDTIEDGTRVSFRADNSLFDFKKLSVREIDAS